MVKKIGYRSTYDASAPTSKRTVAAYNAIQQSIKKEKDECGGNKKYTVQTVKSGKLILFILLIQVHNLVYLWKL